MAPNTYLFPPPHSPVSSPLPLPSSSQPHSLLSIMATITRDKLWQCVQNVRSDAVQQTDVDLLVVAAQDPYLWVQVSDSRRFSHSPR